MRILGIDTATPTASAALLQDGIVIADEVRVQLKAGHAEIILPLIADVCAKARMAVSDLDGIGVSIGPGSFTGLRVGLSTVKGLVYGGRVPVAGISTLLANAARAPAFDGLICSMLDARKKEAYAAFFRRVNGSLARLTPDAITPLEALIGQARKLAGGQAIMFTGDGAGVYRDALVGSLKNPVCIYSGNDYPSVAAAVARLAEEHLQASGGDLWASIGPVYLHISAARIEASELR